MLSAFAFITYYNRRPYAHTNWFGTFAWPLGFFKSKKRIYFLESRWDNPFGGFQQRMRVLHKEPYVRGKLYGVPE